MDRPEKNQENRRLPETQVLNVPPVPVTTDSSRGRASSPLNRYCLPLLGLALLAPIGCATGLGVKEMNGYILRNEFAPAAARVEKEKGRYGDKNLLLYYLDRGLLLQLAKEYSQSNVAFESAKDVARALYTKSVTAQASTFLINDNMTPYAGEDFERALIHVFSAMNYALLGKTEDALVECRQVNAFLKNLRFEARAKNAYQEDAFARYMAGLLYEDAGQINDALISYTKALETYGAYAKHYQTPLPEGLVEDALRTAHALGFLDKEADIQRRWGGTTPPPIPAGSGEVVVLHYAGLGPEQVDSFFEISVFNGWPYVEQMDTSSQDQTQVEQARAVVRAITADKMIRVAFPKYKRSTYKIQTVEVRNPATLPRTGALVEDIGAIAVRDLEDRNLQTRGRAVARAVIKYLLAQNIANAVEKKNDEGLGFLVRAVLQAAAAATEVADKRSWQSLPDKILMARTVLPAGTHTLTLRFLSQAGGTVETKEINNVAVTDGRKTFLIVRTAL